MNLKLIDLATLIRSKNAGPFVMTFDIMFDDPMKYQHVKKSGVMTQVLFSKLYETPIEQVHFVCCDIALAFKASIPRPIPSGDLGCSDMHAGQQYAPLLDIEVPDRE
ncbi:MAG: DUF4387 domain-containing protein [Deltaproteobacteria bacterium]|nr:DUF4387 domain-containing protein [Deltaproteobacteria bacterium]